MAKSTLTYKSTAGACYIGYFVQAIVNNFAPLLFLTFQNSYYISLEKISYLITINFGVQLIVDLIATKLVDKIGYRMSVLIADAFSVVGLVGLSFLPDLFPDAYIGIIISIVLYAMGSGLIEVVISPIIEAIPGDKKEADMSLLHSCYCWGHMAVVILSTLFFTVFGISNWRILSIIWAVVPFINFILFTKVPIISLNETGEKTNIPKLLKSGAFWILFFMMIMSGAAEQSMSQWASAFAEKGLSVSKTLGDLLGPCMFAFFMAISRTLYGKLSDKIKLETFMAYSGLLCVLSYLGASLFNIPWLSLLCCGICGFSVGIFWPGTYSVAAKTVPEGKTAMFALLAFAGDIGCMLGPTMVGLLSDAIDGSLKTGLLFGVVFPAVLIVGVLLIRKNKKAA